MVTSTITTFVGYNMKANVNHISKFDTSQKGHNVQNTSEKESVKKSTEKSTNFASDDIIRKNDVVTTTNDDHQSVVATPNDRHISKSDISHKGKNVENTYEKESVKKSTEKSTNFEGDDIDKKKRCRHHYQRWSSECHSYSQQP